MSKKIIVELQNVSKKYRLRLESKKTVESKNGDRDFFALKGVNLKLKKGERVGIFGENGTGKTTLIRLIAGITTPTSGRMSIKGRVVAITDLEAGFHPDLTGRENVYLNGMLIGMPKKEVDAKYEKIVRFSGIGKFIDAPLYTYSSGMKFRLAFSVAVASKCDILLIDEVFVVGDIDFQQKTAKFIKDAQFKHGVTTLISSHVPLMIWSFSDTFYEVKGKTVKKISRNQMRKRIKDESRSWEKIHVDYRKI